MNSFKKGDIVKYIWPRPNTKPNLGKILLDNNSMKTKMYYVEFLEKNNYDSINEWWPENAIILVNDNTTNTTDNKGQKKYKDTKNLIEYYDTINNTTSN